ncbi:MAG: winged helix-turn-helix domain-containing protein [Caldilineaceae bacterium]|nr:winged helix-turn-helix domain-containing protein [Caldilineaceae bacterium]
MIPSTLYWSAPTWQVLLAALIVLAIILGLAILAMRRVSLPAAMAETDRLLDRQPLFFYTRAKGLQPLNRAADQVWRRLDKSQSRQTLVDLLSEATVEERWIRENSWPDADVDLYAAPLCEDGEKGALGILLAHQEEPSATIQTEASSKPDWSALSLTPTEQQMLDCLLTQPGETVTVLSLFNYVWPEEPHAQDGLYPEQRDRLRQLAYRLRQRIEPVPSSPQYLLTVHGVGYRLHLDEAINGQDLQ